ncbi:MAG: hypothetical protein ACOC3J_07300 [Gemmatimonadota bacterium]
MRRATSPVLAVALVATLLAPIPLAAQGDGAAECCLLLLVPVGARASSMGGTITALQGPEVAFGNPAGLAGLEGSTFMVHHSDVNVETQVDAFSLVLTPFGATVGVSYQLFDNGEVPTTDLQGQPIGELVFRDHLVMGSVALSLPAGLAAGVSYRYFQQRIDCNGQCGSFESMATASAFDAGIQYRPPWHPPLELGLAVVNAAGSLHTEGAGPTDPPDGADERASRLPSRLHLGVAYDVLASVDPADLVALWLTLDARDRLAEPGSPTVAVGLELDVQQSIYLRAGYAPGEGLGTGAAVGVELKYDRFSVAVSRSFVNSQLGGDTEPFQVSFGLHF